MKRFVLFAVAAACAVSLNAQWIPENPVASVEQQSDGALVHMQTGALRIQVCTDSVVHIRYSPTGEFPDKPGYVVVSHAWPEVHWTMQQSPNEITLATASLKVTIARSNGVIGYATADGRSLLNEGPKDMRPVTVNGEKTWHAEDVFGIYGSEEGLYGLGQHQAGVWNYRGESVDLSQENTEIAVPCWLSSKGYGIFWNNDSVSKFNNRFVHYLYVSSQRGGCDRLLLLLRSGVR